MKKNLQKHRLYQIKQGIILFLSLYAVAEFFVSFFIDYTLLAEITLEAIDFVICCIFIADIIFEAWREDRGLANYIRRHLIELVSSIPFLTMIRLLRIFKVATLFKALRIARLLRGFKGIGPILKFATQNRLRSMLVIYVLLMIMILMFCSAGFYMFEKGVNPNVTSFFDAVWWAFMTASSLGDALIYPTTLEGRLFSIILVISGVGLFSLITADISSTFVMFLIKQNKPKAGKLRKKGLNT